MISINSVLRLGIAIAPWMVIVGLLYIGLFVKPKPVGSTVLPTAIEARDRFYGMEAIGSIYWAVGANGKIVRSSDAGQSWTVQQVPVPVHLQDIAAWDENRAVAVGNEGVALYTRNGGKTWQQAKAPLNEVVNKLLDVKTYADGEAWAVGSFGTILVSKDYGQHWAYAREVEDFILNEIIKKADGSFVVVGEFGSILISKQGSQWHMVTAPVESSLMAVAFQTERLGIAAGLEGVLLKTTDGGQNWARIGNPLAFTEAQADPGMGAAALAGDWRDVTTEHIFSIFWHPDLKRWYGVGTKGLWLEADAQAHIWQTGRLAPKDLAWHTAIVRVDQGVVLAGKNLGLWSSDRHWQVFKGR